MKTAIDTSALFSIFNAEPAADAWLDTLVEARREGQLVICEVVYSELSPAFETQTELDSRLQQLGVEMEAPNRAAAWLAGRIFLAYRQNGGPREHLIPDFLIGAHAQVQAGRLAANDRGYLRRYFPDLPLLQP